MPWHYRAIADALLGRTNEFEYVISTRASARAFNHVEMCHDFTI